MVSRLAPDRQGPSQSQCNTDLGSVASGLSRAVGLGLVVSVGV